MSSSDRMSHFFHIEPRRRGGPDPGLDELLRQARETFAERAMQRAMDQLQPDEPAPEAEAEAEPLRPDEPPALTSPDASHAVDDRPALVGISDILVDALTVVDDVMGVFSWPGGDRQWVNDALRDRAGADAETAATLMELLDEWSQAHFLVKTLPVLAQVGHWRGQLGLVERGGTTSAMSATLVAHHGPTGEIDAVTLVARPADLSGPAARTGGDEAERLLAALVEHVSDLVLIADPDGRVTFASPAATDLLGVGGPHATAGGILELIHPDDRPADLRVLTHRVSSPEGATITPVRLRVQAVDELWRTLEVIATDLVDNPAVGGIVLNARDVTHLVDERLDPSDHAPVDRMTGLPNRMQFLDRLDLLAEAKDGRALSLLLIDLDHLKRVNDTFGARNTDAFLARLARRMVQVVTQTVSELELEAEDVLVARLRSDEFAVLLPGGGGTESAQMVAERVRIALAEPVDIDGAAISTTASIGISLRGGDDSLDALLADADRATRHAKEQGRNRVVVYDGGSAQRDHRRHHLDRELRLALDTEGLEIRYQPIVEVVSGVVVGAEALLRVRGQHGELLSPAAFVEAAETGGLISRLGSAVLRTACEQLLDVTPATERHIALDASVNISPRQVATEGFAADVRQVLEETGFEARRLCLEITQGSLGRNDIAESNILRLREMGVRVGLDDFGSGTTSVGAFRRYPLDFVKIDRHLVAGLGANYVDGAIVRSTIELAHKLGLVIVAVGVETESQLEQLHQLGCDRVQGYLFAADMPADALERYTAVRSHP